MGEWFETFFDDVANRVWREAMPPEATAADVAMLERALVLDRAKRVLDVPCGEGRHALALAERGHEVVGVDISEPAIQRLRQSSGGVDARVGDMRSLPDLGPFDGAYCLGNSFGYFDGAGQRAFLTGVRRSLVPGGRFVLEAFMTAESLFPHLEGESTVEAGGVVMHDRNQYDPMTGRLDTVVTFSWGSETSSRSMSTWVLRAGEVVDLVVAAGFDVIGTASGPEGEPFTIGSPRFVVTAVAGRS